MKIHNLIIFFAVSIIVSCSGVSAGLDQVSEGPEVVFGAIGYRKITYKESGLHTYKLTRYPNGEVLTRVNQAIGNRIPVNCETDCRCSAESKIEYAERDMLSIYITEDSYCKGNPHPDLEILSMTFDLKTGEEIEFRELFTNYVKDQEEILTIIFGSKIKRAEKLISEEDMDLDNSEGKSNCAKEYGMENLTRTKYSFNFSLGALKVQPIWPHAIQACAERVTVPYKKLTKFAAPGRALERVSANGD